MSNRADRIVRLKERILNYSMGNPKDIRAISIWKDCIRDIAHDKVVDIYNYEKEWMLLR